MLRSAKSIFGYDLHELDEMVGEVYDLYFDDKRWNVRHLVAKLGGFLRRRKVLVDRALIGNVDPVAKMLMIQQTGDEVRDDPPSDSDKPVYKQFEEQSAEYYQWVAHWTPFSGGPEPKWEFIFTGDSHLRSVRHLIGYTLKSSSETVGKLADFLLEDNDWHISYLVVDAKNGSLDKQVLLPADKIKSFLWEERTIVLDTDLATVLNEPEYQPDNPLK